MWANQEFYKLDDIIKDEFPLAIDVLGLAATQLNHPLHAHDFQELVIVLEGSLTHLMEGGSYTIETGDVFVIQTGVRHGYSNVGKIIPRRANIVFDLKRLELPLQYLRALPGFLALFELEPQLRMAHKFESRLRLSPADLRDAEDLSIKLAKELSERKPGYKPLCLGFFLELISKLSRVQQDESNSERKALWGISRSLRLLENSSSQQHTLAKLARESGMSERNYFRMFKAAVGESPIKYLLNLRLERAAKQLLESPGDSISQIALRTGFYDGNYFARQFARRFKMTPSEYRAAYRAHPAPSSQRPIAKR